ncbi:MAG: methionyl-tRNA formyltransferase [Candidatus Parcubacteria bacterium]|nr:methionyl-tRNA formyltransferase [Candidatus Parcubacteria bacterium]
MLETKGIKIIFMGTPEFSVPVLNALIENYNAIAVVTQPDKKVGRKQVLTFSPIKKIALANKIEILQPEKISGKVEFIRRVNDLNPDLIVIAAYGLILPKEILDIPKYGVINVHASLLPKYRGASPIQAAILNGEKETGVTIMLVNEKMDEGDILSQETITITDNDNFASLYEKLSVLGTHLLIEVLLKWLNKEIKPQKQDESQATYCKLITKEDGKIDWHKSAQEIDRQIRALTPWPGTWTVWNNKKLKILSASADGSTKLTMTTSAGEVFKVNNSLAIQCGQGALEILELQLEGKKSMTAKEFLNGYSKIIGAILK